jgi:hypothetical protein
MRRTILLILLLLLLAGVQTVRADEITMSVSIIGLGEIGSESITGTFQFNPAADVVSDGSMFGTGLSTETWSFGTFAGYPVPGQMVQSYNDDLFSFGVVYGSNGDQLPLQVVLDPVNPANSFVPISGSGQFEADGWFGTVTPVTTPEPPSFLLLGAGLLVLIAIKKFWF